MSGARAALGPQPAADRAKNGVFRAVLLFCLLVGIVALAALLIQVILKGAPRFNLELLTSPASRLPRRAGAEVAIWGTVWVMVLTALMTIPIGIGAAIYMEEYADGSRWYNRLIEVNIQNLAAVPSIVYGILGLAFIVRKGDIGIFGLDLTIGFDLGSVVLAGAMILTLLVLPTIIIAAREALRAVPSSIREGSLALGATRWQTTWRQVLPAAIPGMATGAILALSRAIGETAPLLLVGALVFITTNPAGPMDNFTVLPIQIFNWTSRSQEEFHILAAAAILVLLILLLTMNSVAIWLRNRYEQQW